MTTFAASNLDSASRFLRPPAEKLQFLQRLRPLFPPGPLAVFHPQSPHFVGFICIFQSQNCQTEAPTAVFDRTCAWIQHTKVFASRCRTGQTHGVTFWDVDLLGLEQLGHMADRQAGLKHVQCPARQQTAAPLLQASSRPSPRATTGQIQVQTPSVPVSQMSTGIIWNLWKINENYGHLL